MAEQIVSAIGTVRLQFALISQQFGLHTHSYAVWQTGINTIPVDGSRTATILTCQQTKTQNTDKTSSAAPALPTETIPPLIGIDTVDKLVALFPAFDHDVAALARAMSGFQQAFAAHTHAYFFNVAGISQQSVGGELYRFAITTGGSATQKTDPPNDVATLVATQVPPAVPYDGSAQQEYLNGVAARVSGLANILKQINSALVGHAHGYLFQSFGKATIPFKNYSVDACVINGTAHQQTSVASVPKIAF